MEELSCSCHTACNHHFEQLGTVKKKLRAMHLHMMDGRRGQALVLLRSLLAKAHSTADE